MGTSTSAAQFTGKIKQVGRALDKSRKVEFELIGIELVGAFETAVAADLGGDNMFSGWSRAPLIGKASTRPNSLRFAPAGKSIGPTRVAQEGRHPGAEGPMQGPIALRYNKNGSLSKRQKRFRRWNGTTEGFETWDDFLERARVIVPKEMRQGFIRAAREVLR